MPIDYNQDDIRVVSNAEAIRVRPEMYLGPLPNPRIGNRFVEEVLCLSVDEAVCGRCTEFSVAVDSSGIFTVRDNGPGLPMEPNRHGWVLAEWLLTVISACREAKKSSTAKVACCNIGLVVVNCLSAWLRLRVYRDGSCWVQEYQKGIAQGPFRREADSNDTGLEFSFCPDGDILGKINFDALALASWLPGVGLRFESMNFRPGNALVGEPLFLQFNGVGPSKQ